MHLTIYQRRQVNQVLIFTLIGVAAGLLYVWLEGTWQIRYSVVNAIVIGLLLSAVLALFELVIFRRQKRQVRFITLFLLRMVVYLSAAVSIPWIVIVVSHMRRFDRSLAGVLSSVDYRQFIEAGNLILITAYAFFIMAGVNFSRQISRKLGQGMMLAHLTGRYHQPEVQQRIIMFLDVIGSKVIIDQLGSKGFHTFLNNLIYDVTEPIVHMGGVITHYVEDEIVVEWSMKKGLTDANCIRSYFAIKQKLAGLREEYYEKYGFVPGLRAALHCGTVIKVEMGIVKTEISTMGDVLNTTSRILDECTTSKTEILLSSELAEKLTLPSFYVLEHYGDLKLKGKQQESKLFTVKRVFDANI